MSDIYVQLIPDEDDSNPYYDVLPRIGAFEVSFNGVLLFSKLLDRMWPHYGALAGKCLKVAEAADKGEDLLQYQTTNNSVR